MGSGCWCLSVSLRLWSHSREDCRVRGTRDSCSNTYWVAHAAIWSHFGGGGVEVWGGCGKEQEADGKCSLLIRTGKALLNSVAINDPKAHLGPAPPHPLMASNLMTQFKAQVLNQLSSRW